MGGRNAEGGEGDTKWVKGQTEAGHPIRFTFRSGNMLVAPCAQGSSTVKHAGPSTTKLNERPPKQPLAKFARTLKPRRPRAEGIRICPCHLEHAPSRGLSSAANGRKGERATYPKTIILPMTLSMSALGVERGKGTEMHTKNRCYDSMKSADKK